MDNYANMCEEITQSVRLKYQFILTGFRSYLDEHIDAELATEEVELLEEALEDIEFCIKEKIENMIPMLSFIQLLALS